jgi:hypothetical protein
MKCSSVSLQFAILHISFPLRYLSIFPLPQFILLTLLALSSPQYHHSLPSSIPISLPHSSFLLLFALPLLPQQANKDDLSKAVPYLIAHKQIKTRAAVVMGLLRELEFLPMR